MEEEEQLAECGFCGLRAPLQQVQHHFLSEHTNDLNSPNEMNGKVTIILQCA